MRDLVSEKLSGISELSERRLLKDIINTTLSGIIEYNEDMYKILEDRVFNEIKDSREKFDICSTVCPIDDIDPINDNFFPILDKDLESKRFFFQELQEQINNGSSIYLTTIFMQCDFMIIKELLSIRNYTGKIVTDKNTYEITIFVRPCLKYINELEKLYTIYLYNEITWRTVNSPYINKFLDVYLWESPEIPNDEKITEIIVNLGQYEKYKKIDMIPLWNIKKINLKTHAFPVPAQDMINYEYKLPLKQFGIDNGFLVDFDNEGIKYIKRYEENITIIANDDKDYEWKILKVSQIDPKAREFKDTIYIPATNSRKLGYIGRYANVKSLVIRTKGEIGRLIASFDASKNLEYENLEIRDALEIIQTENLNPFIADNIRDEDSKKMMLIKFKALGDFTFITRDIISFIVSEIQMIFPEYRCVGEVR